MASLYDQLIQEIKETGLTEAEAKHAARRCATAIALRGATGWAAGSLLGIFLAKNVAVAMPLAIGGTVLGVGNALVKSPQCSKVRDAVKFWNKVGIN
jgi:hypothetical protein